MSAENSEFAVVHSLLRRGRLTAALALLLKPGAMAINEPYRSDLNHAWYCVGDIFFRQKKYDDAKNAFKRAVVFRPDDESALEAIGNCYNEQRRPKLAERFFRQALGVPHSINPDERAEIKFNLANALFDQGRLDEAIQVYRQLIRGPVSIRKSAAKNLDLAEGLKVRSAKPARTDA